MEPVNGIIAIAIGLAVIFIVVAYKLGFAFGKQQGAIELMIKQSEERRRRLDGEEQTEKPLPPSDHFG